ncbi:hypothetical protein EJ08DRAFT_708815 [Tothia fuscella]|uniref:2EXR domain-containing protein n=1 Tax=Tothia fuscella TaxID=1048955 RepID=A0A9P4NE05_9PEZI|nr:hypothetical protein EJ08DRAFT_708815 [Tothia fuscella]
MKFVVVFHPPLLCKLYYYCPIEYSKYNTTKIDGHSSRLEDGATPPIFTCFADFPFDIRACIWESVAFLPRDLDLLAQRLGTIARSSKPPHDFTLFRYVTTQPPPAILHVNKESRDIGLKYYSLEFGSSYEIPAHHGLRAESPAKTCVNFRSDRIYLTGKFDEHSFPWVFNPGPTAQIDPRIIQFPLRIAMNIATSYVTFQEDEDNIIAACSPYEEVLLYYLDYDDVLLLPDPGDRACLEFLPIDISTKGNRGLCFELHTRLQALRAEAENSEMHCFKEAVSKIQWMALVVKGQKLGLQ